MELAQVEQNIAAAAAATADAGADADIDAAAAAVADAVDTGVAAAAAGAAAAAAAAAAGSAAAASTAADAAAAAAATAADALPFFAAWPIITSLVFAEDMVPRLTTHSSTLISGMAAMEKIGRSVGNLLHLHDSHLHDSHHHGVLHQILHRSASSPAAAGIEAADQASPAARLLRTATLHPHQSLLINDAHHHASSSSSSSSSCSSSTSAAAGGSSQAAATAAAPPPPLLASPLHGLEHDDAHLSSLEEILSEAAAQRLAVLRRRLAAYAAESMTRAVDLDRQPLILPGHILHFHAQYDCRPVSAPPSAFASIHVCASMLSDHGTRRYTDAVDRQLLAQSCPPTHAGSHAA
jgi:hypothetical protein